MAASVRNCSKRFIWSPIVFWKKFARLSRGLQTSPGRRKMCLHCILAKFGPKQGCLRPGSKNLWPQACEIVPNVSFGPQLYFGKNSHACLEAFNPPPGGEKCVSIEFWQNLA